MIGCLQMTVRRLRNGKIKIVRHSEGPESKMKIQTGPSGNLLVIVVLPAVELGPGVRTKTPWLGVVIERTPGERS
jgi:hypothetical protein